jgi:WD40 repeat protein
LLKTQLEGFDDNGKFRGSRVAVSSFHGGFCLGRDGNCCSECKAASSYSTQIGLLCKREISPQPLAQGTNNTSQGSYQSCCWCTLVSDSWCACFKKHDSALLASAAMDHKVQIWNVWNAPDQQVARTLTCHSAALKDVQWSSDGTSVLSCGFDQTIQLSDIESGSQLKVFLENQFVNVVRFHPLQQQLFLAGGSKGTIKLWDLRTGKSVCEYSKALGQVMDLDFSPDGKRFVSTSDIAKRNASDKALVVWNFETQIALSNQVYLEAYTCPSVRFHPYEASFVAQSNADYIAIFSSRPPFKLNKYKRFEGHQVAGYRIQCNFSPDGELLVTGSADGCAYFYSYHSSKLMSKQQAHDGVCSDVVYHPTLPSVVATCGWDGVVSVFE